MASNIITKDRTRTVMKSIRDLVGKQVLVGIPEDKTSRTQSGQITNAELGYIHETGAPGANIPARPWLVPGVHKAASKYLPHLRAACNAALDGDATQATQWLARAGIVAENYAKREISTGDFVPLKPATVAARRNSRDTQSRRKGESRYMELVDAGMSPASAQAATGIHPLINTGQMRNAVTSVVRRSKLPENALIARYS